MWETGFVIMMVQTIMIIHCDIPLPPYNSFIYYCPYDLYRINLHLFFACAVITLWVQSPLWW